MSVYWYYFAIFSSAYCASLAAPPATFIARNETATTIYAHVYTKGTLSGPVEAIPPFESITLSRPVASSLFKKNPEIIITGTREPDVLKALPQSLLDYANIGEKTSQVMFQTMGDGIGVTDEADVITLTNQVKTPIWVAIYYDDSVQVKRWGEPQKVNPTESITVQRPGRKCTTKESWGICKKRYDRELYFSTSREELKATMSSQKSGHVNVGDITSLTRFIIYSVNGTLHGAAQKIGELQKTGHKALAFANPDHEKVKEKYDALPYPGKGKVAFVRQGSQLSEPEIAFLKDRTTTYIRPACEELYKNLYSKQLPAEAPIPRIALCVSGGGCRAMFSLAGMLVALEDTGLLPFISYIATLSGSTWALAAWEYSRLRPRALLNNLCKAFTYGIWADFNIFQLQEAGIIQELYYKTPQSIITLYGAALADKLLKPYAPHNNPNELFWGEMTVTSAIPYPLYTSVTTKNFSDPGIKAHPSNYYDWVTFSPHEVTLSHNSTTFSIPSWAVGRTFANNNSTIIVPPLSVGYLLGIFGSAMSISFNDIANVGLSPLAPDLTSRALKLLSENATTAQLLHKRGSHAQIPSVITEGLMPLVDGGVSCIFPIVPLLKHERQIDIIITIDGSAIPSLPVNFKHLVQVIKKHNVPAPNVDLATIGKKPYTILWDKGNTGPIFAHLPLIAHRGYKENWDPEKNLWTNTMNFVYSKDQAETLSGLAEHIAKNASDPLKKLIGEWLHEYGGLKEPLAPQIEG